MAKGAFFPRNFWDSPIKDELRHLPAGHLWVFLHLAYGPSAHLSGLYRISVGAIAEDIGMEPDEVRAVIDDLARIGWCDVEYPLVWIRGAGNILDKLGTTDVRKNAAWVTATHRHLLDLPQTNRLVDAFRRYHGVFVDPPPGAGGEPPPQARREVGGEVSSSSFSFSPAHTPSQTPRRAGHTPKITQAGIDGEVMP